MEPVLWQSKDLPVNPKNIILLDHFLPSFSPAPSSSAGSGYESGRQQTFSPPSACPISPDSSILSSSFSPFSPQLCEPFSSQYLLVSSDPGFSFGVATCGPNPTEFEHLSIPLLQDIVDASQSNSEPSPQSLELTAAFTMANIQCSLISSENQLWVGTEKGTLHSLDLSRESTGFKLKNHQCIGLNVPILTLAVRALNSAHSSMSSSPTATLRGEGARGEVLLGTPYGYAVVFEGLVERDGRFKEHLNKLSQRIIRLSNSPTDCSVHCIAHVPLEGQCDTYWCSFGGNIGIFRGTDWCKLGSLDARDGLHLSATRNRSEVNQLIICDVGVWTSVAHCTTVVLRDKIDFSPKMQLTYCDPHHSRQQRSQITTIHYSNSFLFIGTKKGDVMVFRIEPSLNQSDPSPSSSLSYKFMASTQVASRPIQQIFTTDETLPISMSTPPISTDPFDERLNSRLQDTPLFHSAMHLLIVTGGDREQIHLYELSLSPPPSVRSSCTVSPLSYTSQRSNSLRITPQKVTVVSSRIDFTPLRDKT